MSMEVKMNKPLLIAAACAALPACAAQDSAPAAPPATPAMAAHCAMPDHPPPATGALPARARTVPEPQRGTVAPNARVPSQVMTPSMRAMEKAMAEQGGQLAQVEKNAQMHCPMMPARPASGAGGAAPGSKEGH